MAKVKHFLKLNDFNIDELSYLFKRAAIIKANYKSYKKIIKLFSVGFVYATVITGILYYLIKYIAS